ncbi:Elongator complex protein 4 domain-containing protein [Rozella allomycis CSF55]|uniref:Elongator complex protein 4 n=1 Tax=Rozella allomycis (strain CSF55) TaxID=988480 RepID=A0A075B0T6_ROZAC|nr:Elongator complex protein 4 domain-containing protein [Rozella allomycis CSF55]|eukprot:EPZ36096.1 Elongator complex protein 4 domain-containing protein [Rozella allomycis CSF55]
MSAFKRATSSKVAPALPSGTKLSTRNSQLITSSGIESVDYVLGGGYPVGTLTTIFSDHSDYASLMSRYFISQGSINNHTCIVASLDDPKYFDKCPLVITNDNEKNEKDLTNEMEEKMKIAWRYQHQPKVTTVVGKLNSFLNFMMKLKILLRQTISICVIVFPETLYKNEKAFLQSIMQLSDCVMKLEAFTDDSHFLSKDYQGYFRLEKPFRLNTVSIFWPETFELVFKCRRKRFLVEKICLPPELGEEVSRSQAAPKIQVKKSMSCGSQGGGNAALDF